MLNSNWDWNFECTSLKKLHAGCRCVVYISIGSRKLMSACDRGTCVGLQLMPMCIIIVSWESEGRYCSSKMFRWEPEGRYCCKKSMAIAPFWFSAEHLWSAITPFWLSTDDIHRIILVSKICPPPPPPICQLFFVFCVFVSSFCLFLGY